MGYLTETRAYDPRDNIEDEVLKPVVSIKRKKEYYSDVVGSYIVDAITGAKYPWRVGSRDEQRFFRVVNTIPLINFGRKGTCNSSHGCSSSKAFYENPHAYMGHCNIKLEEEYVMEWYAKHNKV
jgi:hypothetical protein